MYKQNSILGKQFLRNQSQPKKINKQTSPSSTNFKKHLFKQLKRHKTSRKQFTNTCLYKPINKSTHRPQQFYCSSKGIFMGRSRDAPIHLTSLNKLSSRSSVQFSDTNVWNSPEQKPKKKKMDDKEYLMKIHKQLLIHSPSKVTCSKAGASCAELQFIRANLTAFKKIVRSQSEERHIKEMIHLDIINTKRMHLKSKILNPEEKEKLLRKQQRNELRLKMLGRIALTKQNYNYKIIKELSKIEVQELHQQKVKLNIRDYPEDLKTSKVIFQKKQSMKRNFIQKLRKQKYQQLPLRSNRLPLCSKQQSHVHQHSQSQLRRNFTYHMKNKLKTETNLLHHHSNIHNKTEIFNLRRNLDNFADQAIEPW